MADEIDPQTLSPAKRALYELRAARARASELERELERARNGAQGAQEPIAIIGMGARFPGGVYDAESLWTVLSEGRDTITEIPADRWDIEAFYDANPDTPGKMYTRHGAFLDTVDQFDAPFFGISPREAMAMDPQQRLLLEVTWEALENAGIAPEQLRGNAGVFVALSNSDYSRLVMRDIDTVDVYSSTGNNFSIAAGRLSYFLGLRGPSMVVDTACSGSLVAVHLACQSLRLGECRTALAGGVNLILAPEINVNFSKARMMATDGRCKTFDASADGYVRGEGCGVIVLKKLSHAQADGDNILAVIRGSAINQDGSSGGLTVPSGPAQEAVIRGALASGQIAPSDIGYIEAHGTGTSLGDPIEAHALAAVFGPGRASDNPLVIGSLKTNVGHLESAAGVAGLMKAVLSLQHESIPAHLHFKTMNPHIDWQGTPVAVPTTSRPWPRGAKPRRAGVSSFGFSGTNAHIIIEEAPMSSAESSSSESSAQTNARPSLLAVSARTSTALQRRITELRAALDRSGASLEDFCATANRGRAHFSERAAFVASTREEMQRALEREPFAHGSAVTTQEVAFLFTGQGSQYPGMGRELYDTEPVFRAALDECDALLRSHLERPLLSVLYGDDPADKARLDTMTYMQPAVVALEWSLARLWKSWGVEPAVVLGHSVGEYAALTVAGVWSLANGLEIIAERGKLMDDAGDGWGMTSVLASQSKTEAALRGVEQWASISAINAPESTVVSGRLAELEQVERALSSAGIEYKRLAIPLGAHSPQMDAIAERFAHMVHSIEANEPRVTVISSLTGKALSLAELRDPSYWARQIRQPVRFQSAVETLGASGYEVFLEVGPSATLIALGQECLAHAPASGLAGVPAPERTWVSSMRRSRAGQAPVSDSQQILETLGALYVRGVRIEWNGVGAERPHRRVVLPTYPFDRKRYWFESSSTTSARVEPEPAWPVIRDAATWQSQQGRLDLSLDRYTRGWPALDRLTTAYIVNALVALGAFQSPAERDSAESLVAKAGIQDGFIRLVSRWLTRLADQGIIRSTPEGYGVDRPLTPIAVQPLLDETRSIFGSDRNVVDWIAACGTDLTGYLTGKISTLETLFPGGSFARAESVYEHAPMSAYFAGIGRATMEALVRTRRGAPIRVVEIGAGTGSTTSSMLPVLPNDRSEYYFTDLSDFFLAHAQEKFAQYDFVRYGYLNAEKSGSEQGYPEQSFDAVVATNVLHATHDIRQTLRNTRSLLAPGGVLILCEVTTYLSWFDITTGLIEGWQLFDDGLRGDHPLLAGEVWTRLLSEAGFEKILALPADGSPAAVLGQHVIVAQVPGEATARPRTTAAVTAAVAGVQIAEPGAATATPATRDLRAQLDDAPVSERQEMLVALVRAELARSLRVADPESLDRKRRLIEFGIDSLMAVELRNRLATALKLTSPLPATLVFDHPSIDALATYLRDDVLGLGESADTAPAETPAPNDAATIAARAAELEEMSDEEVEAQLLRRLQSM